MELQYQIMAAIFLDLFLGDPRGYPHPVRIIGGVAGYLEQWTRKFFKNPFWAGAMTTFMVVMGTFVFCHWILKGLVSVHPWAATVCSIFFIYTALSIRSLYDESIPVLKHLVQGQESLAKKNLAMIVGRDTKNLEKDEITRATVETISENMVDGIIAPLFYAFIGGAPLALAYKAVNTLDSMFGYRNETYVRFGRCPARLDDFANWIPARLAGPLIAMASFICGFNGKRALTTVFTDGQNHLSPNAGIPQAAVAGALGLRLGGSNYYSGVRVEKPFIGAMRREVDLDDITSCHKIMFATSVITFIFFFITSKLFKF